MLASAVVDTEKEKIEVVHIEDNADNRFLIQLLLEESCRLRSYESGKAGLEGLRRRKPQIVLMDLSLPEMGGKDVLRVIRSDPDLKDVPVIALTAHAMRGDRERYLEMGFDEYLTKPIVDENLLLDTIRRCRHAGSRTSKRTPRSRRRKKNSPS